jgi:phage terminase large subunit GpA-like protein
MPPPERPAWHAKLLAFTANRLQLYLEQLLDEALVMTYSKGQPTRERRPEKGFHHEALDDRVCAYAALGTGCFYRP